MTKYFMATAAELVPLVSPEGEEEEEEEQDPDHEQEREETPDKDEIAARHAERLKKLKELHMRRVGVIIDCCNGVVRRVSPQNEARKLNHKEVVEEDRRKKLPANWESRKKKAEWEVAEEEAKKVCSLRLTDASILRCCSPTESGGSRRGLRSAEGTGYQSRRTGEDGEEEKEEEPGHRVCWSVTPPPTPPTTRYCQDLSLHRLCAGPVPAVPATDQAATAGHGGL